MNKFTGEHPLVPFEITGEWLFSRRARVKGNFLYLYHNERIKVRECVHCGRSDSEYPVAKYRIIRRMPTRYTVLIVRTKMDK
jgi:hypothetical protein